MSAAIMPMAAIIWSCHRLPTLDQPESEYDEAAPPTARLIMGVACAEAARVWCYRWGWDTFAIAAALGKLDGRPS
ncbi:hypothetical protein ACNAW0_25405 [Micromonospora sp. SL1-18]|uniref:hypothetical protein n=1 Tax=Micromonospora sp. SL1-18 TaxID=3399128 RepID=UPI003A4E569F